MDKSGISFGADFLYWNAVNNGFGYAYGAQDIVRLDPHWAPGFRVGLGWTTPSDFWEADLIYTWMSNHAEETKHSDGGFFMLFDPDNTLYDTVSADFRLHYNMGDVEFGRSVYLTKRVAFRPLFGVRGGVIDQKFHAHFTDVGNVTFRAHNYFWGVGPRVGAKTEWQMGRGFSLHGQLAGALLYGSTDTAAQAVSSANDHLTQSIPNVEMRCGLAWQSCSFCERFFLKISGAWESSYWWNQFQLPIFTDIIPPAMPSNESAALNMSGATVSFELDY